MSRVRLENPMAAGTTLLTVIAPKFCCWSTALAAITGGTSYLAWVYPMRPYLFALSFLLVGISFYKSYKPYFKKSQSDECASCQTENGEVLSPKYLTWLIAIFVFVTFYLSYLQ